MFELYKFRLNSPLLLLLEPDVSSGHPTNIPHNPGEVCEVSRDMILGIVSAGDGLGNVEIDRIHIDGHIMTPYAVLVSR